MIKQISQCTSTKLYVAWHFHRQKLHKTLMLDLKHSNWNFKKPQVPVWVSRQFFEVSAINDFVLHCDDIFITWKAILFNWLKEKLVGYSYITYKSIHQLKEIKSWRTSPHPKSLLYWEASINSAANCWKSPSGRNLYLLAHNWTLRYTCLTLPCPSTSSEHTTTMSISTIDIHHHNAQR